MNHADLLERLTGIGAEKLKKLNIQEICDLQNKIRSLKQEIKTFTDKLYEQFNEALNRSFELSLAYRYRYASENDALLEVDINLAAQSAAHNGVTIPSGSDLMKEAVNGDFREVFKFAAVDRVIIRKGVLTHKVTRAHELSINLFGWQSSRFEQLITNVEDVIEQKDGGVMHIYGIEAESISKRKRRGEETEQTLAFKVIAEGFQPIGADYERAIDAVTAMSCDYTLRIADPITSREELRGYLKFADYMGLIPGGYNGIEGYLNEIAGEFGLDSGARFNATLKYRLRYDATAMLDVFKLLDRSRLDSLSRNALRTINNVSYHDFPHYQGVAEAYEEPAMRKVWKTEGLKTDSPMSFVYTLQSGGQPKRITLNNLQRRLLDVLYRVEDDFVEKLLKLDEIMDAAAGGQKPNADRLADRLKEFIGFQKDLNKWIGFDDRAVMPPFLAVLNRLTAVATQKQRTWKTTLEMTFKANDDKTITKLLVA